VATQSLGRERGVSIFFRSVEELGDKLRDRECLAAVGDNVWRQRERFTFDYHVDRLITLFREVIRQQ
jgi:hypothetical protein